MLLILVVVCFMDSITYWIWELFRAENRRLTVSAGRTSLPIRMVEAVLHTTSTISYRRLSTSSQGH